MTFTMFDSVTLDTVPDDAYALAGYSSGNWPTFGPMVAAWPKLAKAGRIVSIAVNVGHDALCLDCEPGDATPAEVPAWVERQLARGVKRPIIYTSVSGMQQLVDLLSNRGIHRGDVRLWTAHYTKRPHLCGPQCGFGFRETADATQWTDVALGRNLDQSLCQDNFLDTKPVVDPHYPWYDTHIELNHLVYNGRAIAEEYDRLRNKPLSKIIPNRPRLKVLRAQCLALAKRDAREAIYEDQPGSDGKLVKRPNPIWDKRHLGFKYQGYLRRSRGQRIT